MLWSLQDVTSSFNASRGTVGEMPLCIRRLKLKMSYWINLQGQEETHPSKKVLEDCWEYGRVNVCSFGWSGGKEAKEMGIDTIECCKTISIAAIPPWLFCYPLVSMEMKNIIQNEGGYQNIQQYVETMYNDAVQIYTDASKDPITGKASAAVFIPKYNIMIQKRITDHLSVFSAEMMAIVLALQWVEEARPYRIVICSDSMSSLSSIQSGKSICRQDLLF